MEHKYQRGMLEHCSRCCPGLQMEQWQVRLAEQNAFHWSAISLTGGAICLLACLWCLQTLSATSAALLILLIGTAGWLLHVQAGMTVVTRKHPAEL